MDAPYAVLETLEPGIARLLAHNPSAFTYTGTQSYLVGERGPELFVPTASGRLEAAGGGVRKIAITVNVRGEAGSEPQRLAQTGRQLARAVRRAVAAGED